MADKIVVEDLIQSLQQFSWPDSLVFGAILLICIFIGIYFGFIKKVNSEDEYLAGGRNMLIFPISMSLIVSYISGLTFLGLPADVYIFGMQFAYIVFGIFLTGFALNYIYLPVYIENDIISIYEYLELRFDKKVRTLGSLLYILGNIAYLPFVLYVPALAFNQVTGVNVHVITPIASLICIFYTCVGGIKAVVWTDVIQAVTIFISIILVIVKGTINAGGIENVINININTTRLEMPILNPNPSERQTFWSCLIGGCIIWLYGNATNQNVTQRYLTLPSLKAARRSTWIFVFGSTLVIATCAYSGLLMYATYHNCDPLTTKLARAKDQMLPLFVMQTFNGMSGLTGIFMAGVFSASLSTLSTCLNSTSAIVLKDFVRPLTGWWGKTLTDAQVWYTMRLVVILVGILSIFLVMLVERADATIFQVSYSIEAITGGPLLGVFTVGMLVHWVNEKGALVGLFCGLCFMAWLSLKTQVAIASGHIDFNTKPFRMDDCDYIYNLTIDNEAISAKESSSEVFPLFKISYLWYGILGAMITGSVACLVSLITKNNKFIASKLLTPCMRKRSNSNHRVYKQRKYNLKKNDMENPELTTELNNEKCNERFENNQLNQ